ncbi:hypothetical protein [Chryseobacterium wanjuense]|uniref:hypothetical protein n=1 Tax=Chryseobacterium wanjuense TaxID=356305 RepID=UPI0011143D4C|nr:hypothetical protein [Chryseobacterium wanjuense]
MGYGLLNYVRKLSVHAPPATQKDAVPIGARVAVIHFFMSLQGGKSACTERACRSKAISRKIGTPHEVCHPERIST